MQGNIERLQFTKVPGRQAGFSPHFAAKPPLLWGYFEWLAYAKCFGISGPSSSLTGSNPVGDANKIKGLRPRRFFQPTRSHDERTMGGECEGVLRSFLKNVGRFGLMNADHCIEAAYEINY
jgi:hypothetical protein